jgi:hypothetical protein
LIIFFNYIFHSHIFIADKILLIKIISDFEDSCRITATINNSMKTTIFYYYYISIPGINLFIIAAILEEQTNLRLVLSFISILAVFVLFCQNYFLTLVAKNSFSLYKPLNSLMARKSLNLKDRLKVCSMIERFSGPVIGLYCYDFFPFTNYEFYLFFAYCVSMFILIMNVFKWIK